MTSKPRGSMGPEELLEARRRAKHNAYMVSVGKPVKITDAESHRLMAHVQDLAAAGMSGRAIADASGASATTVNRIIRGQRFRTLRRNYEAIMAVQPPSMIIYRRREGKPMPAWPAARRLQALEADGFPMQWLGECVGQVGKNSQWNRVFNGTAPVTGPFYMEAARELFDKLAGTRPEDHGIGYSRILRARTHARKKGYVPSRCWDWDTIDMEDAIPEWTGHCGTDYGYRLHVVHGIKPVCPPCHEAHYGARRG